MDSWPALSELLLKGITAVARSGGRSTPTQVRAEKIGSAARREIERLVGSKVFLELWVKVRKDWRARDHDLRELGYVEQE